MEELIPISYINDFTFCPASIYFHGLMDGSDKMLYQSKYQIEGTASHHTVDNRAYSTKKDILQGMHVCSIKYGLIGKIDIFDKKNKILIERKKRISKIYPGHIFQLYGQYFALIEEDYEIEQLQIHSMEDNKRYNIPLPSNNIKILEEFENTIENMHSFLLDDFEQNNTQKCTRCIYSALCINSRYHDEPSGF